ncbi:MAG: biotin transporter BioY [Ruminococcus sp.]|jgi:biotin transport system substrate-specific component|nr:biotin transporter BioY [Ruminococcus sp.]
MNNNKKFTTRNIVFMGLFAAITAVLSQISLPLPSNVPLTLQTFAVALAGYFLGWFKGCISVVVYVLIGAVGAPVFAGFKGGLGVISGPTGGFIIGFIVMALLCGLGSDLFSKKRNIVSIAFGILLGLAGLAVCHVFGFVRYANISGQSLWKAFLVVSLPYLVKDVISVAAAYFICRELRHRLLGSGALVKKNA